MDKDNAIIAAASEALGSFAGSDLETRKKCFEELLKNLMSARAAVREPAGHDGRRQVQCGFSQDDRQPPEALEANRGARKPDEFQKFWNKNKAKNWDDDK